ncbi:hypothetical protein LQZ19_01105 [Treponema primitia]|uniref:hypothetical protein n=1 Tax=Treponema primitia TaxID=88058 RepID=UPI003980F1B3
MDKRNILAAALFAAFFSAMLYAEPLVSPSWGYRIDLPEEYQYSSGDGRDKFSFQTTGGANFELAVYPPGNQSSFPSVEALAADVKKRLNSSGETSIFEYRNKKAVLLELEFSLPAPPGTRNRAQTRLSGWGLCMELEAKPDGVPLILALAYGNAAKEELQILYFSALDSLAPAQGDQYSPGPITEFTYPRGNRVRVSPFGLSLEAFACEHDAEGAQAVVDREFEILQRSADKPNWKEAWTRFYRAIYRDSFSRLSEIAFALERYWAAPGAVSGDQSRWDLAGKGLGWVQTFSYERDLLGSDFVNLISAAIEGRGDCDSRAMLWAIIMEQANIPAAIMVSADYGHAMGLIDIPGVGARFEWEGKRWLVAETTAAVALGRIGQKVSDPTYWLGISF